MRIIRSMNFYSRLKCKISSIMWTLLIYGYVRVEYISQWNSRRQAIPYKYLNCILPSGLWNPDLRCRKWLTWKHRRWKDFKEICCSFTVKNLYHIREFLIRFTVVCEYRLYTDLGTNMIVGNLLPKCIYRGRCSQGNITTHCKRWLYKS